MSEVDTPEPSLAEIFSNEPEAPEPEPEKEPEKIEPEKPVETPEKARDEQGRFKAKEPEKEPEKQPEKAEEKPKKPDNIGALIAERRKRQELEKQLEAAKSEKPKTDFYENPDKAFEERLSTASAKQTERFFHMSVKLARIQPGRSDFDEVATAFAEAAESDPRLYEQLRADDDPGEFIYTVGKQIRELGDVGGDIGQYREKVEAEMRAQLSDKEKRIAALEAELAESKKQYEELSTVGRSLNTATSGRQSIAETDDEDISEIVRFKSTG